MKYSGQDRIIYDFVTYHFRISLKMDANCKCTPVDSTTKTRVVHDLTSESSKMYKKTADFDVATF